MTQLIVMAFRDLGRNRRRSIFSALAVGMGLSLLMLLASFIKGEMGGALDRSIQLQSGHIQVRAKSYDESKTSLKWEDLIENPDSLVAQITALPPVQVATPRLFASGFITTGDASSGVRIMGIDPASSANAPFQKGIIDGQWLAADDREGVLLGKPLADKLGLKTGDLVTLSTNTSNGTVDQQQFTVRGVYTTNTNAFDSVTVFLPLAKAQTFAQSENHISTIFIMLKDQSQTDAVVAVLQNPGLQILTWSTMNAIILQTESLSESYMSLFYLIVLAITASVVVNTLIMAVFERTREIGILAALGMKGRRILAMFLTESSILAVGGILIGLALGLLIVSYFSTIGFYIGNFGISGFLIGNTIYAKLTLNDAVNLSIVSFVVTVLAGLIPAVIASRMEPIVALRGGK
jgi:ABC-type lipoprotein release transport system permease subunit